MGSLSLTTRTCITASLFQLYLTHYAPSSGFLFLVPIRIPSSHSRHTITHSDHTCTLASYPHHSYQLAGSKYCGEMHPSYKLGLIHSSRSWAMYIQWDSIWMSWTIWKSKIYWKRLTVPLANHSCVPSGRTVVPSILNTHNSGPVKCQLLRRIITATGDSLGLL